VQTLEHASPQITRERLYRTCLRQDDSDDDGRRLQEHKYARRWSFADILKQTPQLESRHPWIGSRLARRADAAFNAQLQKPDCVQRLD
jgi:hypothetical protein